MEVFIDGGLFELIIAIAFGCAMNFILLRKHLLIAFSASAILSPTALFFIKNGEAINWIAAICIINAVILTILLWKHRADFPGKPLIDTKSLRKKIPGIRKKEPDLQSSLTEHTAET